MMQPGDTFNHTFFVKDTSGTAVTGLLDTTNLTLSKIKDGATSAAAAVFSEIGGGYYNYAITTESSPGQYHFHVTAVSPVTHLVDGGIVILDVEAYDIDSLYARVVVPRVSQSITSTPASDTILTIDANRWHNVAVSIVDQSGAAIDLSTYNNFIFTVRDSTHASINYSLTTGISGDAAGLLTFTIPETASFYTAIDAAIALGRNSVDLYYDVKADNAATATQTQNIMRGKIVLRRYEGAA